jgi:hypothetical protein
MFTQSGLLDELFAYLEQDPPLNSLLSAYTSRVAGVLLQKKVADVSLIRYVE